MNDDRQRIDRRRVLAAFASTATVGLAGCLGTDAEPVQGSGDGAGGGDGGDGASGDGGDSGDSSGSGDGSGGGSGGDGGSFDCAALGGATTTFDRATDPLSFLFDYPTSFEEYNQGSSSSDSVTGAMLGHAATKGTGYYEYVLTVTEAANDMDPEHADGWVSMPTTEADAPVDYGGRSADRSVRPSGDDAFQWYLALPNGDETSIGVQVQVKGDSDRPCIDALESIARDAMDSFRPA